MRAVAGFDAGRALDVGGGPGNHASVWAGAGHRAVVLDPGAAMVRAAAARDGVTGVQGIAQQMPFAAATFDVVYFHLSIHYGDWRRSLDEAMRVAAPGGSVWIWTLGPDHHAASFLTRWFPSVEHLDRRRFPAPDALAAYLGRSCDIATGTELEVVRRTAGDWAAAVEAGFVSTLQLVPGTELVAGLAAFRDAHPDPEEIIDYDMHWTWLAGRV